MMDDDDDWQEMPVVRERSASTSTLSSDEGEGGKGRQRESKWNAVKSYHKGNQLATSPPKSKAAANATGTHLDIDDARGYSWRAKPTGLGESGGLQAAEKEEKKQRKMNRLARRKGKGKQSESSGSSSDSDDDDEDEGGARGYTQLRLDDDPEVEQISAATDYLFTGGNSQAAIEDGDAPAATPHSQLNTTKNLLSEGQKIAYVGLVSLVAKGLIRRLQRVPGKELQHAINNAEEWRLRVMARLFQHMEIESGEQKMIESLSTHGVLPADLSPSLITTQTVDNPDFDPEAEKERGEEEEEDEEGRLDNSHADENDKDVKQSSNGEDQPPIFEAADDKAPPSYNEATEDDGDLGMLADSESTAREAKGEATNENEKEKAALPPPSVKEVDDGGDISSALNTTPKPNADLKLTEGAEAPILDPHTATQVENQEDTKVTPMGLTSTPQTIETLPSALDGVTTELSSADKTITLDLRWTVLCDLFLVLTADSVYDSRSRVLLETVAEELGLHWMDVTKFEKRVTDALEIEEGVSGSLKGKRAVRKRAEAVRRRRMVMMGLATVGGGLVIGLSAGLMAPLIGAGLGAALGTIGIGGTTGFLGGVGGAAIITTTGTVGGAALGGTGMSKRTRTVRTFEFKPIHNNKRVNCIVAVPGFMSGPLDDPRLPFSVIDSIMGDVFSILWEPDMMQEMGNAIYLLWNETLVQGVQQVLAATIAGGLVGALAWPLWLTKLGYFIDNPWSNALDRAHSCGLILADVLMKRKLGVRPITLVGFSLGARVIFYALVELARQKKYGIVQNVYLMGAPVTANDKVWKEARGVVAGRFVNAFSRTDWILGWLFRATTGGLRSIAGLRPVERVPEVENVDVTQIVPGHLQYRAYVPLVLDQLGFRTTADYFDEPEDLNAIPEREIRYDESVGQDGKPRPKGFAKLWSSRKNQDSSKPSTPTISSADYDEDVDLPPRQPSTPKGEQVGSEHGIATPSLQEEGDEVERSLAELRESGVEVRELESKMQATSLATNASGLSSETTLGVPSQARFKVNSPNSPVLPSARSSSLVSSRRGSEVSVVSTQGSADSPASKAQSNRPGYARKFGSTIFDADELPPPAVRTEGADVSLSFAESYDDDNGNEVNNKSKEASPPKDVSRMPDISIDTARQYGLSDESAKELARQFQSSGMSTAGASAAAKLAQNFSEMGQDSPQRKSLDPTAADPWSTEQTLITPPSQPSSTLTTGRLRSDEDELARLAAKTSPAPNSWNDNPWG